MQPPQPPYSPDGQWWWDGYQWRPIGLPRPPSGLFWFFESGSGGRGSEPDWIGPVVLIGLINVIPIVGAMVLYGWVLAARDNLRRGWLLVPPAGFSYIERGARVFLVGLVYTVAFWVAEVVLLGVLVGVLVGVTAAGGPTPLGVFVWLQFVGSWFAWTLVSYFLLAALISVTDRYGAAAGLNPARLWGAATASGAASWKVAGAIWLGTLILSFANLIPFVGFVFVVLAAPAVYLMAAPYLAQFDETRAA